MKNVQVIISDTHFGVKSNSIKWLNSQTEFIDNQLVTFIKSLKDCEVTLIHCGDVFDSRSSINPFVCHTVNGIIKKLSEVCKEVIIIGGNHDYYSPNEAEYNINSLDMLKDNYENVSFITHDYKRVGDSLFIPWYSFHNTDTLKAILKKEDARNIFTHTDLAHMDADHQQLMKGYNVVSGHIHIPDFRGSFYTVGSCFALDFADCNNDRGFYVMEDWDVHNMKFIANKYSIKFWRFQGDDLDAIEDTTTDDQIELYVSQEEYQDVDFQKKVKKLRENHDINIIVQSREVLNEDVADIKDWNIEKMCLEKIPANLKDKFQKIVEKV